MKPLFKALSLVAALACVPLIAYAASTTYTDAIKSSDGGPVSLPAGATVTSTGTLTVAGPLVSTGTVSFTGAVGFTGATYSGAVGFTGTGGMTAPTGANGTVYSSSAALTLTAGTNVAAVVTPVTLEYFRIGKQVCAYGQVSIDPTSATTASVFTLSLPVVPTANFSGTSKLSGQAGILGGAVGSCLATDSAKTATCNYISGGTAVELVPVNFCYSATGA